MLIFLFLFLVQIGYGLFTDHALSPQTGSVDVVVRTFASAVFGYFLSGPSAETASFTALQAYSPQLIQNNISPAQSDSPKNRMGFSDSSLSQDFNVVLPAQAYPSRPFAQTFRICVVACVGIASLLMLLILRNTMPVTDSMIAPVTQLRDMISSSIGYLVGSKHD